MLHNPFATGITYMALQIVNAIFWLAPNTRLLHSQCAWYDSFTNTSAFIRWQVPFPGSAAFVCDFIVRSICSTCVDHGIELYLLTFVQDLLEHTLLHDEHLGTLRVPLGTVQSKATLVAVAAPKQ